MPASNALPLADRIAAALKAGPKGSKPYLASMQASLRVGKGITKTTKHAEVQRVISQIARSRTSSQPIRDRQRTTAKQRRYAEKRSNSRANLRAESKPARGATILYGPVDRPISAENITIKLLQERLPDTTENRAYAVSEASSYATSETVELSVPGFEGRDAEVNFVQVTANPAGRYPVNTMQTNKTRGQQQYEDFDAFIEIEVWVEIEGT
jgi:hypothetical protein